MHIEVHEAHFVVWNFLWNQEPITSNGYMNANWVGNVSNGWKSFKVYHIGWKRPSPYCGPFLLYIFIPIKENESKVVENFKMTIV